MFDDLFKYVFTQLELSPTATFRESELISKSKESFDRLLKDGLIVFDHYDSDGDSYFSDREGDRDCERYIRKRGEKILAQAVENDVRTIELSREEIAYYRFNFDVLLSRIKDQNGLSGKSDCNFSSRIFYVGTHSASNTAVLLGFLEDEAELLSIWSKIEKHDHALIICPSFVITSQDLLNKLDQQSIQCRSFIEVFQEDFVIDSGIIQKFKKPEDSAELTKSERAGYNSFHYKRKDTLEFTDEEIGHRSYVVKVNGKKISKGVSYAELILLMFLAMRLKEGSGGWVNADEIAKEEITGTSITHLHQLISDIKKKIAPYLESSSEELIENIKGKSQYRISTHPCRVKAPSPHWLRQTYKKIKAEVLKERERRSK